MVDSNKVDFNADEKEPNPDWACVVARHEVSTNLVEPFEVLQHQSAGGLGVLRLVLKGTAEKCGAFTSSAGKAAVGRQNIWETGDGLLLFCQISSNMSHHFMLKETLDKL